MKLLLLQLDPDKHPSAFDRIVAYDAGVDEVLSYGAVQPADVRALIHGAVFTRSPSELRHTAVWVGGSDVGAGEALADAAREDDQLAGARVPRRVLRAEAEVEVAPRDPAGLAAPAHVDDPRVERQQPPEGRDGLRRRLLLEARDELES